MLVISRSMYIHDYGTTSTKIVIDFLKDKSVFIFYYDANLLSFHVTF